MATGIRRLFNNFSKETRNVIHETETCKSIACEGKSLNKEGEKLFDGCHNSFLIRWKNGI